MRASRASVLLALAVSSIVLSGCDSGPKRSFESVQFRAADGVRLDGRLFGRGKVGVVLVHMGREGDSQADWAGLAEQLDREGYAVLTFNRRGVCPGGAGGCSKGIDDYASSWRDVVGAAEFLRGKRIDKTVVVGASIGAMSSLYAASKGQIKPAGLVEFGGINHASGYDFDRSEVRRIGGSKLFLSSRGDIFGGADAAREWYRWASPPKHLELVPGGDHGTDLLRADNPLHERVAKLIIDFVQRAAPPGG